jgi:S-(hydroxymethyl)mycothiol dehydrogenase
VIEGRGAVVDWRGGRIHVEAIEVDEPGPGEVLVRVLASGICHSDHWAIRNGNWGSPFPMLLGHEGAGVVQAVGEGVRTLADGDRVVLSWAVPCGTCRRCRRGQPRRCAHEWLQPPRLRVARTGAPLVGTLSLGTLATHTVVHAAQAIAMPPELDPSQACLIGCGVSTGIGGALQTGGVREGDLVAVIGLGGVGLAAVQGARIAGAERVVAIDLVAGKLGWALELGATDAVDASRLDPVEAVRELTDGVGVDVAIEATGVPTCVGQAVAMCARGGTAVAIGVPPLHSEVTLGWSGGATSAYPNKVSLVVTDGGDPVPAIDFPEMAGWALEGRLDLSAMVSHEAALTDRELADAFEAMLVGSVIRTVVRP